MLIFTIMFTNAAVSTFDFTVHRSSPDSPWILWGGAQPGGSLKYLTFKQYLSSLPRSQIDRTVGLIEISEGCTALALDLLGRQANKKTAVVCSEKGAESLRGQGFMGECCPCRSLEEAFRLCEERSEHGWLWPRQMTNRELVNSVESWSVRLADFLVRRGITVRQILTGFGTGATAAGLSRAFTPLGVEILAVESRPDQTIAGWRHFPTQNLGSADLFAPFLDEITRIESPGDARDALSALLQASSCLPSRETLVIAHNFTPVEPS